MPAYTLPFALPQRVTGDPPPTGLSPGTQTLQNLSLVQSTNPQAVFSNGGASRYIVAVNTLQNGGAQAAPAAVRCFLYVLKSSAGGAQGSWNEVGTPGAKQLQTLNTPHFTASGPWRNYGIVQDGSDLIVARYTDDFASDGSGSYKVILSRFDMNADDWGPDLSVDTDPNVPTADWPAGDELNVGSQQFPQLHLVKRPSDGHFFLLWTGHEEIVDPSGTDLVIEETDAGILDSGVDGVMTTAGVFSSASHTFVPGDIGSYINVPSGGGLGATHFILLIVSVSAGAATVVSYNGPAGSGVTWQMNGRNVVSSVSHPFTTNDVFRSAIQITAGTGFNTAWSGSAAGQIVGITGGDKAIVVFSPYSSTTFPNPAGNVGTLGSTGGTFTVSTQDFQTAYSRAMLSEFDGANWLPAVMCFGVVDDPEWYAASGLVVGDNSRLHAVGWRQYRGFDGQGHTNSPAYQLVRTLKSDDTFTAVQEEFYSYDIQAGLAAPNGPNAIPITHQVGGQTEVVWPFLLVTRQSANNQFFPQETPTGALKVLRFVSADTPTITTEVVLAGTTSEPGSLGLQSLFWTNSTSSNWPAAVNLTDGTLYLLTIGAGPNIANAFDYLNIFTDDSPWDGSVKLFELAGDPETLGSIAGAGSYPGFIGIALTNGPLGSFSYDDIFYFEMSFASLSIICDDPPEGIVGTFYSHAFPASGGTPPYTFAIIAGNLPPGLTLDPDTGIVSGTPTLNGVFPFTIQVTDSADEAATASVECSITIRKRCILVGANT